MVAAVTVPDTVADRPEQSIQQDPVKAEDQKLEEPSKEAEIKSSLLRTMEIERLQKLRAVFPFLFSYRILATFIFLLKKGENSIFSTKRRLRGAMVALILIVRSSLYFF